MPLNRFIVRRLEQNNDKLDQPDRIVTRFTWLGSHADEPGR
jgi:hypothetical protein